MFIKFLLCIVTAAWLGASIRGVWRLRLTIKEGESAFRRINSEIDTLKPGDVRGYMAVIGAAKVLPPNHPGCNLIRAGLMDPNVLHDAFTRHRELSRIIADTLRPHRRSIGVIGSPLGIIGVCFGWIGASIPGCALATTDGSAALLAAVIVGIAVAGMGVVGAEALHAYLNHIEHRLTHDAEAALLRLRGKMVEHREALRRGGAGGSGEAGVLNAVGPRGPWAPAGPSVSAVPQLNLADERRRIRDWA